MNSFLAALLLIKLIVLCLVLAAMIYIILWVATLNPPPLT